MMYMPDELEVVQWIMWYLPDVSTQQESLSVADCILHFHQAASFAFFFTQTA